VLIMREAGGRCSSTTLALACLLLEPGVLGVPSTETEQLVLNACGRGGGALGRIPFATINITADAAGWAVGRRPGQLPSSRGF
jgi:hypothetical protein